MKDIPYTRQLFHIASDTIQQVLENESGNILQAAALIAESILQGGMLHVYGAGHSHLFSQELCFRAGGLVPVNPISDINYTLMGGPPSKSSRLERLEGYVELLMDGYIMHPGEVLIVMSHSGRNPGPVEAALYGRQKGLKVVTVTSLLQSSQQTSRHSSGKRLFELADVVIDSHVPFGDAVVEISPDLPMVSPISTIVGAAVLEGLVAEVAGMIHEKGETPPIWVSSNVDGGDKHNRAMAEKFQSRVRNF
jgi:uncharacterized phosphosugar-binding protein